MNKIKLSNFPAYIQTLSHVAVVIGIVFAVLQYLARENDKAEQVAIAHLQNFHRPDLVDARVRLQVYWIDKSLKRLKGKRGSEGVIDTFALKMVFPDKGEPNFADLLRIVEQLDVIAVCVLNGVCDKAIIVNQLGPYIRNFHCLYGAPLERLRKDFSFGRLGNASLALVGDKNLC